MPSTLVALPHITLLVFLIGTASFLCSMLVHIQVWRALPHARTIARLFAIFVIWPALFFLALAGAGFIFESPGSWFIRNPANLSYVYIWHLELSAIYIMTYPAIQAQSPTLVLLLAIARNMPEGLDARQIREIFSSDALLHDRFADLVSDGFLICMGEEYTLTAKGRILRAIFFAYRRLMGLPRGEG